MRISWERITLKQFEDYLRGSSEKELSFIWWRDRNI